MKADRARIQSYLMDIRKSSLELNQLIDQNELIPDSLALKATKYVLIELAEAMANTIQHILAKEKGVAVSGYVDTIVKAYENGLITEDLFERLKPFFDFGNSLVHGYWTIDDQRLIENIKVGRNDFERFLKEIEASMAKG